MEGTPFGRYRLIEMLGRGGMGEVWRAWDTATKRTVAIKVLPPHLADDNEFVQRFRREAEAAAQLNSPHVIPIHNYGEIGGRLYVDMRLIDGRDLATLLTHGPLEAARAVRIIDQIAKALYAAHKVGLIHRDIKPSNILLDDDDFAYLIDFGIARAADETRMTKSGYTIGTLQYIAPEQLDSQAEEDARADIYSLACVLYEALTGEPPFFGRTTAQLMFAHLNTPPPRPSVAQPDLSPQLDEVIATGMAKDPNQRYATTVELADAAHDAITEPVARAPSPPTLPATERAPLPPAQRAGSRVTAQPATVEAQSLASAKPPPQPTPPIPTRATGISRRTAIALIVGAAALVAVIVLAIGIPALVKHRPSESSPTSSSLPTSPPTTPSTATITPSESVRPTGAADFTSLLIQPSDVGPNAIADGPPQVNPSGITGVGQVFKNPDGRRTIVDTVAVFTDAATAAQTAANMKDVVGKKVNGQQQPIDIGSNGFMVMGQGTDPGNPMEISEAVFVEGKVMVDLESDCVIGNPTPSSVLLDLARKQDTTVKSGMPT